ncbi:MAG: hypothetical protein Q7R47_05725 [Candidatus Diapherotrites archaeon]|nr:hypothetical protein [Candidatus Diapherotrites archaeon]
MVNYFQLGAIILAGLAVAIADALIKKTAQAGDFWAAFRNPLMIGIVVLYLVQVAFFVYVFSKGWNLGIVGNIQMVFYSIGVVSIGLLVFGEELTLVHGIGIVLALVGVLLMNL